MFVPYKPAVCLIHRCVHRDSGSTTVMWPILCPSTEVLRGWAFLTGNGDNICVLILFYLLCHL